MVRVLGAEGGELVRRARVFEAAPRIHVGEHDDLLGAEDLRGFGHEAHAAEGDHVGVGRVRLAAQLKAVADEVREVLDLGLLVIMGEDDGVALLAQPVDLGAKVEPREAPAHSVACVHLRTVSPRSRGPDKHWRRVSLLRVHLVQRARAVHLLGASPLVGEAHLDRRIEPGRAQRKRKAPLDRPARGVASEAHRHRSLRLPQ